MAYGLMPNSFMNTQKMGTGQGFGMGGRGSPMMEGMYGDLLSGLLPSMPSGIGAQNLQGGMGIMGLSSPSGGLGIGYSQARRFSTVPSLKDFLKQYAVLGQRMSNMNAVDPRKLLKL